MATLSASTTHIDNSSLDNIHIPDNNNEMTAKRLLVVPQVLNDSTTVLQKSPTIDEDNLTFKAILSPLSSASKDQFLKSVDMKAQQGEQIVGKHQKKEFTLVTVPKEDISKSAVMTDYQGQDEDDAVVQEEDSARDDYISNALFRLRHGFNRNELALVVQSQDQALNAVQELKLIHKPHTGNFMMLVEQLQAMRTAAVAVQLEDTSLFESAVLKCERVFQRHQKFDQVLDSDPTQYDAVKALHELVRDCHKDTTELMKDWALVYHTLQELVQRIQVLTTETPKSRKSVFSRKAAEVAPPQISPEALQYQKDVCINWAAQMKAFEQLAQAYRTYANQATEFVLLNDIEAVVEYCGDAVNATFEKAQTEFLNTKQLSHLHYQIDYINFGKTLPKDNALTTAEERKAHPMRPLFTRDMVGQRQLVRDGKLTEFVSPFAAAGSKKKNTSPAVPKEYQLIVASDTVYLCEVICTPSEGQDSTRGGKKSNHKSSSQKQLRLVHEPVLVIDSQISSTPDVDHPPLVQKNIVMVCFYNQTSYILQAESSEERDAWVECARQLDIEQPKPTEACREQDENEEIQRSMSSTSIGTVGKNKGSKMSLFKRLKTFRRSSNNLPEDMGPIPEIDPDQITHTDEEEKARRMQLGQPSLWEVRRLPLDLGVIPPLEHPIPFRKSHLYDSNVKIVDLTTGKIAAGEFGMGIEDRAAYFRDECALFAVLRPARLIPFNDIDRQRDDFFLCCKRLHKGEVMYVEPPYITDFYARSWLHPDMHVEFDADSKSVMIAKMYRIICSTPEIVTEFQNYHAWLMQTARISPDNTFLCMDYRSQPLRIAKRIERAAGANSAVDNKDLEAGRKYTELGECNIEFRRMSNAPDALSVGFYNPATKRDMAIGVMVFDKSKVKATASSLGLDALNALGPSNGVVRVCATEMSLTIWQTDARTRPTFIKGQRVFETVKSKSLDMFKITGQREALDELEEFMRVKNGTDCKARDIKETFKLIRIAFHEDVLNAPYEDEEKQVEKQACENHRSATEASEQSSVEDNGLSGHRVDGHLETVVEEDEEDEYDVRKTMSASTATFRLKSRSALILMEKHQKELAAAEALADKALSTRLPEIESCSFDDLAGYLDADKDGREESECMAAPSVANLAEFWAKTTSAIALVRSTSSLTVAMDSIAATTSSSDELKDAPEPTTELEARVNAVKAAVLRSSIVLQANEEPQNMVNADGVVQATRYLHKRAQTTDGVPNEDVNDDIEPGVNMEHHMPVKDLRRRWEEIYRLGM